MTASTDSPSTATLRPCAITLGKVTFACTKCGNYTQRTRSILASAPGSSSAQAGSYSGASWLRGVGTPCESTTGLIQAASHIPRAFSARFWLLVWLSRRSGDGPMPRRRLNFKCWRAGGACSTLYVTQNIRFLEHVTNQSCVRLETSCAACDSSPKTWGKMNEPRTEGHTKNGCAERQPNKIQPILKYFLLTKI